MSDLDKQITEWRKTMVAGGLTDCAVLDELESHLRDAVESRIRSGEDAEAAFHFAVQRIGLPNELNQEFRAATQSGFWGAVADAVTDRRRCYLIAAVFGSIVAVGFFWWRARATPIYQASATIALRDVHPSSGYDARGAALRLNSAIMILQSRSMRTRVAESLSSREQAIVNQTNSARGVSIGPMNSLGVLHVVPVRLSFVLYVFVQHESAEAAALLANRYAELFGPELAGTTIGADVAARQMDRANPGRLLNPTFVQLSEQALALGLISFLALRVAAAALRRVIRSFHRFDPPVTA
jgi:hypothetical protein